MGLEVPPKGSFFSVSSAIVGARERRAPREASTGLEATDAEAAVEGVTMFALATGVDAVVCRFFRGDLDLGAPGDWAADDLDRFVGVLAAATALGAAVSLLGWDMIEAAMVV